MRVERLIDTAFKFIGIVIFAKWSKTRLIGASCHCSIGISITESIRKTEKIKTVATSAKISDLNFEIFIFQ